jgi:NADH-quinone oxidoreductase subunit J
VSRPEIRTGGLWQGIGAVGLFVVITAATLAADFGDPVGFSTGERTITEGIGNALFNFAGPEWFGEGFLATFIIVAVVLDVALDSSLLLAKREEGDDE